MRDERLEVSVTFDERHGYVASAPELRHPIVALSLASLRKRIEIALLPDDVRVVMQLDGLAERERHRRRAKMGATWGDAISCGMQRDRHHGGCLLRCTASVSVVFLVVEGAPHQIVLGGVVRPLVKAGLGFASSCALVEQPVLAAALAGVPADRVLLLVTAGEELDPAAVVVAGLAVAALVVLPDIRGGVVVTGSGSSHHLPVGWSAVMAAGVTGARSFLASAGVAIATRASASRSFLIGSASARCRWFGHCDRGMWSCRSSWCWLCQ